MQIVLNCHKNNRLNFCYAIYNFRVFFVCFFLLFSVMISHLYANANASPAQTRLHLFWPITFQDVFQLFTSFYLKKYWKYLVKLIFTEPFKGHCGGKNSEWVEKNSGWEEKIFFKCFAFSRKTFAFPRETLRSLAKLLRSLAKIFAFPRKTYIKKIFTRESKSFARERKYLCERTQKFCEGTQISLRENAKVLRENAKFLEGTQKFCERTQNIWKIFFPPILNFFPLTPNFSHHNVP